MKNNKRILEHAESDNLENLLYNAGFTDIIDLDEGGTNESLYQYGIMRNPNTDMTVFYGFDKYGIMKISLNDVKLKFNTMKVPLFDENFYDKKGQPKISNDELSMTIYQIHVLSNKQHDVTSFYDEVDYIYTENEVLQKLGLNTTSFYENNNNIKNIKNNKKRIVEQKNGYDLGTVLEDEGFTDTMDANADVSLYEYGIMRNPNTNQVIYASTSEYSGDELLFGIREITLEDAIEMRDEMDEGFFDYVGGEYKDEELDNDNLASFIFSVNQYNGRFHDSVQYSYTETELLEYFGLDVNIQENQKPTSRKKLNENVLFTNISDFLNYKNGK